MQRTRRPAGGEEGEELRAGNRAGEGESASHEHAQCTHAGCGQPMAAPGRLPTGSVLKLCTKCRLVAYCSKECQTADWKLGHKKVCGTRAAGGAGGGGGAQAQAALRAALQWGAGKEQMKVLTRFRSTVDKLGTLQQASKWQDITGMEVAACKAAEALRNVDPDNACFVYSALGHAHGSLGDYRKAIEYHEQALTIAKQVGDREVEGGMFRNLGNAHASLGDYGKALEYHGQDLAIAVEVGDRAGEGRAYKNLGITHRSLGHNRKALEYFEQIPAIAVEVGDRAMEGRAYANVGIVHGWLGNYRTAIEYHEQDLAIVDGRDRAGEFRAYGNLGNAHVELGNYRKAIEYHGKRLTIAVEVGDRAGEGRTYGSLGNAHASLGDYGKALEYHGQHLAIAVDMEDREGEGRAYGNLGIAYKSLGEYRTAIEYHEQSLAIAVEVGNREGECASYSNLGNAHRSLGNYRQALEYHGKTLTIAIEAGNRLEEGRAYGNLGNAHHSLGDYRTAIEYHKQNLAIAVEAGDRAGGGRAYGNLGNAHRSLGDYRKALEYHGQHLAIAVEVGDRAGEGTAYGNLGLAHDSLGDYRKALVYHGQDLAIAVEVGDRAGEGTAYGNLGNVHRSLGDYRTALKYFESHLAIAVEVGDRTEESAAYGNLGNVHVAFGDYRKAIEYHGQHLAIAVEVGDRAGEGKAYANLGNAHASLGDYRKAIEYHGQHLAIAVEVGDRAGEGAAYGNLGNAHASLGDYRKALEYHGQDLAIAVEVGDRAGEGGAYGNLGNAHQELGDYRTAIEYHGQRLAIAVEVGNRAGEGTAYGNLGNAHQELGDYRTAIEYHEQALTIAVEVGDRAGEGGAYANLGNAHASLGDYRKAIEYHGQHLAIAVEVGDRAGEGAAYGNLGNAHRSLGDYRKALEYHGQHLAIAVEVGDRAGEGAGYNNMALAQLFSGQPQEAAAQASRAVEVYAKLEGEVDDMALRMSLFAKQVKSYSILQEALLATGRPGLALAVAEQSKARVLSGALGGDGEMPPAMPLNKVDGAHESADPHQASWEEVQRLAQRERRGTRIVEYSFHGNGLAVWVLSSAGELLCSMALSAAGKRKESKNEEDARGKADVEAATTAVPDGSNAAGRRSIKQILAEARRSMNVRGRDAMAQPSSPSDEPSVANAPGDKAAETTSPSRTPSGDAVTSGKPKDAGTSSASHVRAPRKDLAETALEDARLRELYQRLIEPVEQHLEGAQELLIIPHKELFEVPWAALVDAHGRYLIERHVLRVAPSLRVAVQAADKMKSSATGSGHIVIVGNPLPIPAPFRPLPEAEKEADRVETILNKAGLIVDRQHFFKADRNPKASKENVKEALQGAEWAHVASHGDLDTDSLVLASQTGDDKEAARVQDEEKKLEERMKALEDNKWDETAHHFAQQKVQQEKAELTNLSMREVQDTVKLRPGATVSLSACNTGRGEIKAEGVVGLARAFLVAGAAATVVSLWSVDDGSTAALMEHVYTHLVKALTVPQALRLAMLRLAGRPVPELQLHDHEQDEQVGKPAPATNASSSRGGEDDDAVAPDTAVDELLDGFTRAGQGGTRDAGGGGLLDAAKLFAGMLAGDSAEGSSRCAPMTMHQPIASQAGHQREDEAERKAYWREFCVRDVAPTCVIDFPYEDSGPGGLNLSRDTPDDRLLERIYCFEDREDDMHLLVGGRRRRVVVKAHTLVRWRDRREKRLWERAAKITAVKVTYAYWNPQTDTFEVERDQKLHDQGVVDLKLVPVAERMRDGWRDLFRQKRFDTIEWAWNQKGSIPAGEDAANADVVEMYEQLRETIRMGESIFPKGATEASMKGYHSGCKETAGVFQTNKMLRDGREVECELFVSRDVAAGLKPAWKRPMHWAGFMVVGATTRLPLGNKTPGAGQGSSGTAQSRRAFAEWSVEEVCELVRGIGFTDAARVLAENRVDGKTLCSADFDCFLTMDVSDGGLGLKPMQKARLKREMETATKR